MPTHKVRADPADADVLIGGFCSSTAGYEFLRASMQQHSGRPTIFVGLTRWRGIWPSRSPVYPRALFRQAQYIAAQLRRQRVRKVRLYGHSLGAALALIVADAFAEYLEVEQIVLLNPACVYADGTWPLLGRFMGKLQHDWQDMRHHSDEQVRAIIHVSLPGVFRYVLANIPRSIAEGVTISRARLFTELQPRLAARGIRVCVGYSRNDPLFLADAMLAELMNLDPADVFPLEGVGHDAQFYPQQTAAALKCHGIL